MKKVILLCVTCIFFFGLFSQQAIAKKPPKVVKVDVCHIIEANDVLLDVPIYLDIYGGVWVNFDFYFGKEISIAESALEDHLAHGDFADYNFGEGAMDAIYAFREAGAKIPAADCWKAIVSVD